MNGTGRSWFSYIGEIGLFSTPNYVNLYRDGGRHHGWGGKSQKKIRLDRRRCGKGKGRK